MREREDPRRKEEPARGASRTEEVQQEGRLDTESRGIGKTEIGQTVGRGAGDRAGASEERGGRERRGSEDVEGGEESMNEEVVGQSVGRTARDEEP